VDRSDDMRIFAKAVESGSFAGAAARLNIAASKLRHPVSSPPPPGARHRMRPAETDDMLPRLKNRSTALRARKGWRTNSPRSNAESVAEHESEALRCPRKDSAGDRPHCPLAPWGARRPAALVAQRRVSRSAVRSFIVLALVRSCFI
jgi:hypothetical protein